MEPVLSSASVVAAALLQIAAQHDVALPGLKLQKLLYYAQGFHLALLDTPLFDEPVLRWEHGPVVESVWRKFRRHTGDALPVPAQSVRPRFTEAQWSVLSDVVLDFGSLTGTELRLRTHGEDPWLTTSRDAEITVDVLALYFGTLRPPSRSIRISDTDWSVVHRCLDDEDSSPGLMKLFSA